MASWNVTQQAIGDKHAVRIRRAFLDRIKLTDIRTNWENVENAISQGENAVYNSIQWAKWIPGEQMAPAYNDMYYRAKEHLQNDVINKELSGTKISPESFTMPNPEAEAWLLSYSAKEIVEITLQDRETIRVILATGAKAQQTYRKTAADLRQVIGLNSRQATALQNYKANLIKSGKSPEKVKAMSDRYAAKLLRYRSTTIALTESHTATNQAWHDQVMAAVKDASLDPKQFEMYWHVARDERLCERCMALAGATSPIDVQDFKGQGIPPLHPRCRCVTIMRRKR